MEDKKILRNAIQTPDGTILESTNRHDYKTYTDKNGEEYMVDGGKDYLRRSVNIIPYTDLTVIDDGTHKTRREYCKWGVNYTKDMELLPETVWKPIKDLETDHIKAILDGNYSKEGTFYNQIFKEELKFRENG